MMPLKTKTKYRLLLLACVLLSAAGIVISVWCTHDPLDGPRGGAIAMGFTLAFVVLKPNLAIRLYLEKQEARRKDRDFDADAKTEAEQIQKRFREIETAFSAASGDEEIVNKYLVWATVVGTVTTAFADIACQHLMRFFNIVSHLPEGH